MKTIDTFDQKQLLDNALQFETVTYDPHLTDLGPQPGGGIIDLLLILFRWLSK